MHPTATASASHPLLRSAAGEGRVRAGLARRNAPKVPAFVCRSIAEPAAARATTCRRRSKRSGPQRRRSGRARILVVEDNPLNRLLLHDILELRGHEVIEAANVDEALPLLDAAHLDLLLLDVQIPGGGGEAVVKEVRKRADLATCRSSR